MLNTETPADPQNTEEQLVGIRDALLTLGITGDSLFAHMREDIERGLISEARTRLDFVDEIINANDRPHAEARSSDSQQRVVGGKVGA